MEGTPKRANPAVPDNLAEASARIPPGYEKAVQALEETEKLLLQQANTLVLLVERQFALTGANPLKQMEAQAPDSSQAAGDDENPPIGPDATRAAKSAAVTRHNAVTARELLTQMVGVDEYKAQTPAPPSQR